MRAPDTILPLVLRGVSYDAGGGPLVDSVSCAFQAGPRTIVLGPNGAGKSLLLRLCHGLIRPTAGEIVWQGARGRDPLPRQAMVFQRPVMLRRSAAANLSYALSVRGVPRRARAAAVAEALERTGLGRLARRPARVLSAGEQQRLALARAWALEPEVLFLDEPTANLDPAATAAVEDIIDAIHAAGTRVIMTTHDLGQARRLADEVMFLHRGRLVEHAAAAEFFAGPRSDAARAFLDGRLVW
jgi:tungstate transport system ATP-binding protein